MTHHPASWFTLVLTTLLVAACSSQEPPSPVTAAPVNTAAFDVAATRKVIVWKQEDGAWKIHANIRNTNSVPAPVK